MILPFYRNPLVREAVDSILSQTFRDFELIAIDDCSGNDVISCLKDIDDPRLRLIQRETNGGENQTRNHGVSIARGKYIAFQDHDDVSYPDRLRKQVEFLESNPGILGCGTACHYGSRKVVHTAPTSCRNLRWEMVFNNHVMFPTVMVRSEVARRLPFGDMVATDDYRWLFEVLAQGEFLNLPEILLHYRMQPSSLSMSKAAIQLANQDICRTRFAQRFGVACSTKETELLQWLGTPRADRWPSVSDLREAGNLLERLAGSFQRTYPGEAPPIHASALSRLRFATTVSGSFGLEGYANFRRVRRAFGQPFGWQEAKLLVKCAMRGRLPSRDRA